jgi:hypothetical protein
VWTLLLTFRLKYASIKLVNHLPQRTGMRSLLFPRVHRKARWCDFAQLLLCASAASSMLWHIKNAYRETGFAAHGPGLVFDYALTALTLYGTIYVLVRIRLDMIRQSKLSPR